MDNFLLLTRNLILTILLECAAAHLIGIPVLKNRSWLRISCINLITNPAANLLYLLLTRGFAASSEPPAGTNLPDLLFSLGCLAALEGIVFLGEIPLIRRWIRPLPVSAVYVSLAMNACSFLGGIILWLAQ